MRPHTSLSPRQFAVALMAVALGGAVGTALRDLTLKLQDLSTQVTLNGSSTFHLAPSWLHYVPWDLMVINFIGAFLATRALRGPLRGHDPNDPMRLLVITGFFGGLTSYSGLFVDFDVLWHHSIAGCLLVAVAAILSGVFAAWLGLRRWSR